MQDSRAHSMIATDADPPLTAFQRDLILVLGGMSRPDGRDVLAALESDPCYDSISRGRLYPNLNDLVTMGLVRKGRKNNRANWFMLSSTGEEVREDLCSRGEYLADLGREYQSANG